MLRLLVYGYTTGVRSSRAIERRLADDIAFRFLAGGQEPDFRPARRDQPGSPLSPADRPGPKPTPRARPAEHPPDRTQPQLHGCRPDSHDRSHRSRPAGRLLVTERLS